MDAKGEPLLNRSLIAIVLLLIIVAVESTVLVFRVTTPHPTIQRTFVSGRETVFTVPYYQFNQSISNDTEYSLDSSINGSWRITIQSNLEIPSVNPPKSEAQVAIAPAYPLENLSIPTIIVQMRGDNLLRIEYFAQDWENSYGFVLYNSTSPGWMGKQNITLTFVSFAPPVPVNPQIAPRPNGNLTISIGSVIVLSNYMVSWANLASFYVYGLTGSTFTAGTVTLTTTELEPS
jgi:hypothetical protein